MAQVNYKLEEHVNDWVKSQFEKLGLKSQIDYLIEALHGRAKTESKTNFIMETFISAIQKLVIKDVVLYADEKNAMSKEVINGK